MNDVFEKHFQRVHHIFHVNERAAGEGVLSVIKVTRGRKPDFALNSVREALKSIISGGQYF